MAQAVAGGPLGQWRTDLLRPEVQTVLPFLEKLNAFPDQVTAQDVHALRQAGLSDEAIRDAVYICGAFNMIDRLADAFGFEVPPPDQMSKASKFLLKIGYR